MRNPASYWYRTFLFWVNFWWSRWNSRERSYHF